MTAGSHKKYLFDNDFGQDEDELLRAQNGKVGENEDESAARLAEDETIEDEAVEEAPPPPTYSEEDLARAREEGLQTGRDEATRDMASAMEQRLANTLDAINTQVATLFDVYAQDKEEHSRDAVGVATVIVRKLFPALNMDKAMAEIEHMIVEAMKRTSGAPALIVRVPKDMHREVEDKAMELAALRSREGALNVIADESMAIGDVAVEWDGGGMARDTHLIWREIDEIIERNLGQKMDTYAPPQAEADPEHGPGHEPEQWVVNPAQVSENEENPVESPQTDGDPPESPEHQEHNDEPED